MLNYWHEEQNDDVIDALEATYLYHEGEVFYENMADLYN